METMRLVEILDAFLGVGAEEDYCPNGLQVEGTREIRKIVTGVSASLELFEAAIAEDADAVLVHHGLLWHSSRAPAITGVYRRRLAKLFESGMSLIAYHLPLDRHMEVGNAAVMGRELGLQELEAFGKHQGLDIGVRGRFPQPLPLETVLEEIGRICGQKPHAFGPDEREISSMGIVTGAAQREYYQAVEAGLDAYITGEVSEWVFQQAREEGVPYIAAGHYATERFGVQALGRWLEETHGLEVHFIDLPNPV